MKATPLYDGRKLKALMGDQGRKARWLAAQVGVSESHLSRVMTGERLATQELADRVCDVLNVPLFLAFDLLDRNETLLHRTILQAVAS
jgi:transcriptional regulator with XRE-family HTH domain